ncbi:MAG: hypothetical protein QXR74_03095, partial [Candidatus Bathyarchaeia archaeon]
MESLKAAISLIIEAGYQIDKDAFELLKDLSQKVNLTSLVKTVIDEINSLSERPIFITRKFIEEKVGKIVLTEEVRGTSYVTGKTGFQPYARGVESDFKVISDPTEKISGIGSLEDCIEYFRSRFKKLSRIIRSRTDAKDAGSISDALKASE